MTPAAFRNALIVHSAIGGSTNATLHLPSIARELGYEMPIELFDEINHQVPHLGNVTPSGKHLTESFWFAGGIPYVQLLLKDMLDLDVMTVTGKTLGENLEDLQKDNFFERNLGYLQNYGLTRDEVIFPVEKATEKGSVAILKGNIAPEGSVVKYSAVALSQRVFTGPARVFNEEEDAYQAVVDKKINPGDIIVIRYEGPRGCGMPEMLMTTEAIVCDESLNGHVALITDGRFTSASETTKCTIFIPAWQEKSMDRSISTISLTAQATPSALLLYAASQKKTATSSASRTPSPVWTTPEN